MKTAHLFVLPVIVLALAGCSHTPGHALERIQEHSQAYYLKHPEAMKKAMAACLPSATVDPENCSKAQWHNYQNAADANLLRSTK